MKKIGIVTIWGNNNYGNRLQNYALQEFLKSLGDFDVETIKNSSPLNNKKNTFVDYLKYMKLWFNDNIVLRIGERHKYFDEFAKNVKVNPKEFTFRCNTLKNFYYDFLIFGSDQVWNPGYRLKDFDLGLFGNPNSTKIAYAASLSTYDFPDSLDKVKIKKALLDFKAISIREDIGKNLISDLTEREDIEVMIDPTMLLSASDWEKVMKRPSQLKSDKFILNYYLGDLSVDRLNEINRIAKANDCEIINLLDKNSPFYNSGPSEFLWLEKNAFLICTDSFHSCVFAFLFNKPFVIFDREKKNVQNMNSRFDTLITKFNLKNRKFEGKITEENLNHDYSEAYKILEVERKKSKDFLERALDIKK